VSRRWIFLDLDGPVLDVSRRYHQVHRGLVLRHGGRPLDREEYWDAKRNRVPEAGILARCGVSPEAETERLAEIEAPAHLALDRPWPWTGAALEELARWGSLALVTLRRHPDRLADQLAALDLTRSFERIVAGRGDGTSEAKAVLLRESGIDWGPGSVLVGDTEVDIASGKALGLRTVALSCGIRAPHLLERWSPDALLSDLRDVPSMLSCRPGEGRPGPLPPCP
jgi:phosphoglycolate phosphatase-like HAD superfamily hydrolase